MEWNLTEMLPVWFSTLFLIFVSIGNSRWLLVQLCILIGWFKISSLKLCVGWNCYMAGMFPIWHSTYIYISLWFFSESQDGSHYRTLLNIGIGSARPNYTFALGPFAVGSFALKVGPFAPIIAKYFNEHNAYSFI